MYNRKNTFALEELLRGIGIDFKTELEIAVNDIPSAVDFHAAVVAAKNIVDAGIHLPCIIQGQNNTFTIQNPTQLKGFDNVTISSFVTFDNDFNIIGTSVAVRGLTMAQHKSMKWDVWTPRSPALGLMFENVNIGMILPIPVLMAAFTDYIFKLVFNSEYEEDFVHMALLDGDHVKGKHPIFVNGNYHDSLTDHQTWCIDKQEIPDLLVLAAILFHREQPEQEGINFVLELPEKADEGHPVLAIQVA